jgi:ABC-type thiamin/hydroxymethylpyrimidine transport system permease subunit
VGGYGAPTGYEFQREDHETIRTTGQRARAWGICALVIGALLILFAGLIFLWSTFFAGVLGLAFLIPVGLQALVLLACGWFYLDAGVTLDRVVTTQGRDVPLMMEALARLTTAFKIETFALGAALIFGFVLGLIFAT